MSLVAPLSSPRSAPRLDPGVIKALCVYKSLTQRELARLIGAHESVLCDALRGRRRLSEERLNRIAHLLGVSLDAILVCP